MHLIIDSDLLIFYHQILFAAISVSCTGLASPPPPPPPVFPTGRMFGRITQKGRVKKRAEQIVAKIGTDFPGRAEKGTNFETAVLCCVNFSLMNE